jgi:iron complex outermembrane receptor protein
MRTIFFVIGLLLLPFWSQADVPQRITGIVLDAVKKTPVSNALVYIEQSGESSETDDNGIFSIVVNDTTPVVVEIVRLGYQPVWQTIDVRQSATSQLKIFLQESPINVEEIVVVETATPFTLQNNVLAKEINENTPKDVGLFLKTQPGFAAIRRGGYAIDPVMRGFKYEQLNIQYDGGIKVTHACPNRMDPVSSHIRAQDIEKIEIVKGPYSVRYGQTMGGIINLIQKRPERSSTFITRTGAEIGYDSNGDSRMARAMLTFSNMHYDLFLSGGTQDVGNYQDGDGATVPSSYRVNDYLARLGLNFSDNQRLQLSWRQSFTRDVLHAGLPMDSKSDDTDIWSLDYRYQNISPKVYALNAKLYGSHVDHVMNNFQRPNIRMVKAVADVQSDMLGGKVEIGLMPTPKGLWYWGVDFQETEKAGFRNREVYMMNGTMLNPPKLFTDDIWQDAVLRNIGVYSEMRYTFSATRSFLAGFRIDRVSSRADSPAPQFISEYGNLGEQNEITWGATLTLNQKLSPKTDLQIAVGRGARTADITERYINHLTVGQDAYEYFGNPFLKPEVNYQSDVTLSYRQQLFTVSANIFYAYIDNYITARVDESLPRLYLPQSEPKFTRRFVNIDRARQTGFEFNLMLKPHALVLLRNTLSYTHATDLVSGDPLPEIPPFAWTSSVRYNTQAFFIEGSLRLNAAQNRISKEFGERETPGFTVVNLLMGKQLAKFAELNFAVENLFDAAYYEHLNRAYNNMSETGVLYEPGRNFKVILKLNR